MPDQYVVILPQKYPKNELHHDDIIVPENTDCLYVRKHKGVVFKFVHGYTPG